MRFRWPMVMAVSFGVWACSGNVTSDGGPDNLAAGNAGELASGGGLVAGAGGLQGNAGELASGGGLVAGAGGLQGNAGELASGGGLVAGAGGLQGSAGSGGAAGAAASAAGTSGDTSGTDSCPVWPRARLMPVVGPFFYGMDPGPCSDGTFTYAYEAGRMIVQQNIVMKVTTTYEYDAQGLPTGSKSSDQTSSVFEFGADYLLVTEKKGDGSIDQQVRYTLSPNGYPTTFSIVIGAGPIRYGSYSYSNCRLLERTRDVGVAAPEKVSYAYDSLGHVSARTCGCPSNATFDYSCWK